MQPHGMFMKKLITLPDTPFSANDDGTAFDRERERLHRQMLSSVSHDLKTPLASIIGSLEVFERMKDKLAEDKKIALIEVALQEAYRLDNFITNILDMAKLENGMVKAKREDSDVAGLVRDSLMRINNRLSGSIVHFNPEGRLDVATDAVLLSRAICLVLDNAVKYGGKPPIIDIEIGKKNEQTAFISIQDNGSGILPDRQEVIFSKYTRFGKEDQQNAGTGLGLSIGRAIMQLLGGDLVLSATENGKTIFILSFSIQ